MSNTHYLKRARQRFLAGTRFKVPAQAVEEGRRSLMEWTEILEEEREAEVAHRRQGKGREDPSKERTPPSAGDASPVISG